MILYNIYSNKQLILNILGCKNIKLKLFYNVLKKILYFLLSGNKEIERACK